MKKLLSAILIAAMILAVVPYSAMASEGNTVIEIEVPTFDNTVNRNSLVVTPEITVVSGETPASYKYQWYAQNNKSPYDEHILPWETNASIKIHSQIPAGWWLWFEATPLDAEGNAIGESVKVQYISTYPMYGKTHNDGDYPGPASAAEAELLRDTPEEYLFEVDGVRLILLDRLYNGQYYVMMDEAASTGKIAFDGTIKSLFDPNDSDNIAYWLNNDFLSGNDLPESVKSNIVEGLWTTEGDSPSWGNSNKTYKVGLLSYSEYNKYLGRFGLWLSDYEDWPTSWDGFWLRTLQNGGYVYTSFKNGGFTDGSGIIGTLKYLQQNKAGFARPTFRLSENFFTSVGIDLATAGEKVKEAIGDCDMEDLENLYTKEELIEYGIIKKPEVKGVSFEGNFVAGDTVKFDYVYFSENNTAEGDSLCGFSVSDTPDGAYTDVATDSKEYTISDADLGKYLSFYVIPYDEAGVDGELYRTKPILISEKAEVVVTSAERVDEIITVTLKNLTEDDKAVTVMASTYDGDNNLTGCYAVRVTVPADDSVTLDNLSLESEDFSTVKVMVWDSLESMKSIYLSEI